MKITINGSGTEVQGGKTILEVCRENGVDVPSLCFLKDINRIAACRVCLVDVNGRLVPACATAVREDMVIDTCSPRVLEARRKNLELICSDHSMDCTECRRGPDCELRELCREYGVDDRAFGPGHRESMTDSSTGRLIRDNSKCILCRRCMAVCEKLQGVKAIAANRRGGETNIGFGLPLSDTDCTGCGQCAAACPTGALLPTDGTKAVWKALFDKDIYVAAAVYPEVWQRIGELFGDAPGASDGAKLAEMLRKIGFDAVFDMSGSRELAERTMLLTAGWTRGIALSGDCPAWRRYIKRFHPEQADRLLDAYQWRRPLESQCRKNSGSRAVYMVEISNCIAAKTDTQADTALTTREAFEMIRRACVSSFTADRVWHSLKGQDFDLPSLPEAPDVPVVPTLCVSGLAEAEKALHMSSCCALLNVHACPGGCINGGGLPHRGCSR